METEFCSSTLLLLPSFFRVGSLRLVSVVRDPQQTGRLSLGRNQFRYRTLASGAFGYCERYGTNLLCECQTRMCPDSQFWWCHGVLSRHRPPTYCRIRHLVGWSYIPLSILGIYLTWAVPAQPVRYGIHLGIFVYLFQFCIQRQTFVDILYAVSHNGVKHRIIPRPAPPSRLSGAVTGREMICDTIAIDLNQAKYYY